MKFILIIIAILILFRFTPLQQLNPLATPRDCFPIVFREGEKDPRTQKAYKENPIRTILFGMRCVSI